ncbi:HAMP domain-containing protein [Candidatus Poribacteria bacterium]|nr:HAMP domain-containing protein [Candidatus Poribacteria bacterium]
MSLRKKILLILLVIMTLYIGLDYGIQRLVIYPSFLELEKDEAGKDMQRCVEALRKEIQHLDAFVHDWSAWDDTYKFVEDRNQAYIEANLVPTAFSINKLNLIYICNMKGEVVWGKILNPETEEPMQIWDFPTDSFPPGHTLLKHESIDDSVEGILMTEAGPMMIASRPIVTSNDEGPIRGSIMMGRLLDRDFVKTLSLQTRVTLELWPLRNEPMPLPERVFLTHLTGRNPVAINYLDEKSLQIRTTFPDINETPALLLRADIPRNIAARGTATTRYATLSALAIGLIMLSVMLALLGKAVISPIEKLTNHAIAIGKSSDLSARISSARKDELGTLAREFDGMVQRLSETRQKLLDQSYYSGMAEVAAGVLHNIRNSLSPIMGSLDGISRVLKNTSPDKIEMAQKELTDTNTPGDRRKDLNEFLTLGTKRLLASVKEAITKVQETSHQAARIEEILADQEKFSRTEKVLLPLNVADTAREAIHMIPAELLNGGLIKLHPTLATVGPVMAQRTSLLQVFSNLFTNAAESIHRANVSNGSIVVRSDVEQTNGASVCHVRVEDNGEGIRPGDLERIFERGFSTKPGASSGIGLHWCANTVAAMNGRIYAQSDGIGRGACLHILIPMKQ